MKIQELKKNIFFFQIYFYSFFPSFTVQKFSVREGKRPVSGQSESCKFSRLPDRTWCPVEPKRQISWFRGSRIRENMWWTHNSSQQFGEQLTNPDVNPDDLRQKMTLVVFSMLKPKIFYREKPTRTFTSVQAYNRIMKKS